MVDFKTQQEVLHKPFSIEKHKETFVNYLEVCIDPCGIVHYAVPSHQEWMIQEYMKMRSCSREDAYNEVSAEHICDFMEWLAKETMSVAVWNDYIIGKPNRFQRMALSELQRNGLYFGDLWNLT